MQYKNILIQFKVEGDTSDASVQKEFEKVVAHYMESYDGNKFESKSECPFDLKSTQLENFFQNLQWTLTNSESEAMK